MWKAIEAAFLAIAAWLNFQIKIYPEKLASECDELENEIQSLERSSNPADHLRADELHKRVLRKRGVISCALSAPYTKHKSGDTDSDI